MPTEFEIEHYKLHLQAFKVARIGARTTAEEAMQAAPTSAAAEFQAVIDHENGLIAIANVSSDAIYDMEPDGEKDILSLLISAFSPGGFQENETLKSVAESTAGASGGAAQFVEELSKR